MQLLSAVLDRTDLHLSIWIDESKTIDDQPDPAWVYESTWGSCTDGARVESAMREATLLASDRLRALTPVKERVDDARFADTVKLIDEPTDLAAAKVLVEARAADTLPTKKG